MRGLVRISTGKAIQWRGPGHSVNRRTPKIEKLLTKSTSQKSAPTGKPAKKQGLFLLRRPIKFLQKNRREFKGQMNRGNRTESLWEANLPLRDFSEVFRGLQRFTEVFRVFKKGFERSRFWELLRGFSKIFRGPLRDPLRGRVPSQRLSVLLPLPLELSPKEEIVARKTQERKSSLSIKFLGRIFLGHQRPRRRDYPGQQLYASGLFLCFREWPGCPVIWVGMSWIWKNFMQENFGLIFSFPKKRQGGWRMRVERLYAFPLALDSRPLRSHKEGWSEQHLRNSGEQGATELGGAKGPTGPKTRNNSKSELKVKVTKTRAKVTSSYIWVTSLLLWRQPQESLLSCFFDALTFRGSVPCGTLPSECETHLPGANAGVEMSKRNGGAATKGNDQSRPRKNPRASKRTSRRFSCGNS